MLKAVSILGFVLMIGGLVGLLLTDSILTANPVAIAGQALAVALMIWARITFGSRSFHAVANPTAGGLVTTGPYHFIRHPIYTAVCLFGLACVISHWSPTSAAFGALMLAGSIVTTIIDIILHVVGVYPSLESKQPLTDALCVLALSYRIVISVAGAWLTAWLAPRNPMKHAMTLGVVGTLLGLMGVVLTWNAEMGPRWYAIALMVLAMPQCWVGGKLFLMRKDKA